MMNPSSKLFQVKVGQLEDAAAFFRDRLGMSVELNVQDKQKCIVVKPNDDTEILLTKSKNANQTNHVTLNTTDCIENYCRLKAKGIVFKEGPLYLNEGLCAVFSDPFGNDYTLLEPRKYTDY